MLKDLPQMDIPGIETNIILDTDEDINDMISDITVEAKDFLIDE